MERVKKRTKELGAIFLIIFAICIAVKVVNLPVFHVEDDTIKRNLEWLILPMDGEPVGRSVAWDSELPGFVQQDIEYAEKHGYEIEYEFKGNVIYIEKREDEWNLSLKTRMDIGSTWDALTNFSIYQTQDHKIVIYGYTFRGDWFQKITLRKNESRIDTITYNADLPLEKFPGGESIGAMKVAGYSLMQEKETFTFYNNGYKVSSQEFPHGTIMDTSIYRGLILTEGKKLYLMYVELVENIPTIRFTYVGMADSIVSSIRYSEELYEVENDKTYLSMVMKDEKYYALVPRDWETFDKFSLTKGNKEIHEPTAPFDFSLDLIELETSFKEAYFHYSPNQWHVNIIFNFNGREFYINYFFGGYDDSIRLPEEVVDSFDEKSVKSFEKMWETIYAIRTAYFDHYENRWDFAGQKE